MATPTLEDLIHQQIELGHKDPHSIYDAIERQLGDDLVEIAKPYLADFVAEMARHKIGRMRRAAVAKITEETLGDPDVLLRSLWVPSEGTITYKRIADMTADDFLARADYLDRMVQGIARHAQWCRDVAADIKRHKVKTAGRLPKLPPLPDEN